MAQTLLVSNVKKITPEEKHITLLDVCQTRWVKRIDGLDRFEDMFEVVMVTLQTIRDDVGNHWNNDSRHKAGSLFYSLAEFSFIFSMVVAKYFFFKMRPLTTGLQKRELEVDFVKNSLKTSAERDNLERIHQELYDRATTIADFIGSKPGKPRICKRMTNRENHEAPTSIDYYRVTNVIF